MANYYNPEHMKRCATQIENQIKEFEEAKSNIDDIIYSLQNIWDDEVNQDFVRKYNIYAKNVVEEMDTNIKKFAGLMKQCGRRYSVAIDNGNSNLYI